MTDFIENVFSQAGSLLLESSVYILFGLTVSGLMHVFLNPSSVVRHFSKGRFRSVIKAAVLGIPIPLCSCGVLPAAVALRKRGANKGATTAFLISTPESGIDSIAITYALLDPIMTVARPVAAFITATAAGITENLVHYRKTRETVEPDLSCSVDACCDGQDCPPEAHALHHTLSEKIVAGFRFAFTEIWGDMAGWFLIGLVIAGAITAAIPEDLITRYLGGGLPAMLFMLAVGIPLYICATASTPIAAALILKGISPGAALVFLMAGPATNITSLTVLLGTLGKRATAIYLATIAVSSVLFGLAVDHLYIYLGFSARAVVGQAGEIIPPWAQWMGALILLALSVKPLWMRLKSRFVLGKPVPAAICSTETCSDLVNNGIAGTGHT